MLKPLVSSLVKSLVAPLIESLVKPLVIPLANRPIGLMIHPRAELEMLVEPTTSSGKTIAKANTRSPVKAFNKASAGACE